MKVSESVPGLPSDSQGEPVFEAPWQAQAFAMTLALFERGLFSWPEWAQLLGREIADGHHGDGNDGYYHAWLAALEKMAAKKGLTVAAELRQRRAAWADAARNTPHGQPIRLGK